MGAFHERYARAGSVAQSVPSGAAELDALRQREENGRRRTSLTWCAILMVVLSFTDEPASAGTMAIRLGIAAISALAGWQWPRIARTWPVLMPVLLTVMMHAGYLGLVLLTGGLKSLNFPWTIALPLACVVILPVRTVALTIISVSYSACCVWVAWKGGLEGEALFGCASDYFASIAVAAFAARHIKAMSDGEARLLSSLQNVQSRAVESERLAVVGRLAAGVAHEINNPLAFVKANVVCLAEELEDRTLEEAELRELAQETQVGLQRIESIVSDLKEFAREAPLQPVSCELSDAVQRRCG